MKEREFVGWALDVAASTGWRAYHIPAPMRGIGGGRFVPEKRAAGLPDLILLREDPARLIFAEAKTDSPLSDTQREFLRLANLIDPSDGERAVAGYVWRPGGEAMIETVLRSKVLA